jgi:hypothetical protein
MEKFLTLALLASSFGIAGGSPSTSLIAMPDQAASETVDAPRIVAAKAAEAAKPKRIKYVAQVKKWGTLRAKFVVDGDVAKPTIATNDPACGALPVMTENLIVGSDGSLKNLAIYMDKKSKVKDIHPNLAKPAAAQVTLGVQNCVFVPHVLIVRPGQSIAVANVSANFNFLNNNADCILVPAGAGKIQPITVEEPAPISVESNLYPWMRANLIIQDHPYVGVSNEDGVLEIADLPIGQITFRVWHEAGTIDEATVGGKKEKWSRGRMEIEIKEGVNELGTIKIAADRFTQK